MATSFTDQFHDLFGGVNVIPVPPPTITPPTQPAQASAPTGATQVTPGPVPPTTQAVGATAGQVYALWLIDTDTNEVLVITPSRGSILLNDLDLGAAVPREVVYNKPNQHGTDDFTQWYANRPITMSLTCVGGPDVNGTYYDASAWADLVDAWLVLGRSIKMVYQLKGQQLRQMGVRVSTKQASITGNDVDRFRRLMTWSLIASDPFIYEVPQAGLATDPNMPDWYLYPPGGTGLGQSLGSYFNFNGTTGVHFPINFAGGSDITAAKATIPASLIGSMAVAPIISVYGGCTQPKFTITDPVNGVRAILDFSAIVNGISLITASSTVLQVDVSEKTAITIESNGVVTDVYRYLVVPADWEDFRIQPQFQNTFTFDPVAGHAGLTTAYLSFRRAFA